MCISGQLHTGNQNTVKLDWNETTKLNGQCLHKKRRNHYLLGYYANRGTITSQLHINRMRMVLTSQITTCTHVVGRHLHHACYAICTKVVFTIIWTDEGVKAAECKFHELVFPPKRADGLKTSKELVISVH